MGSITVGQKAPDFSCKDQSGKTVSLNDYKGKWVVLYSYPKDDTPGCTKEACQFTEQQPDYSRLNAVVLGISGDDAQSHQAFIDKYKLKIPLLCDPDKKVMSAYDMYGEKVRGGKTSMGVHRKTVLINPQGKIAEYWPAVSPDGHAAEVQAKIEALSK
jgi:peroxiredoxin Q/BCP